MTTQEEPEEDSLFEHHKIIVDEGQDPLRIDKFLLDKIPNVNRSQIQNGIKDGYVVVNDQKIKANYKVRSQDIIQISLPEPPREGEVVPEDIPLDIRYEDDYLMIIYKPPGMVVHPAYNNWSGTLVNGLVYYFNSLPTSRNGSGRPGLVHRIDKNTSGLLVIAKTEEAMTDLALQFYNHTVERTYYALVWRDLKEDTGTITGHIGRSLKDRRVMTVFPEGDFGKHAVTHYEVLERFHYVTLVKCNLETGRTHQIRAHMKYLGHPLFNDVTYGGDSILAGEVFTKYRQFVHNTFDLIPRQALHAKTLGFIHPVTKKQMSFDTDIPEDMEKALDKWRHYLKNRPV